MEWKLCLLLLTGLAVCCHGDDDAGALFYSYPSVTGYSVVFPKCWPQSVFNPINTSYYEGEDGFLQYQAHGRCQDVCNEQYGETYYGVKRNNNTAERAQCGCVSTLDISTTDHICNYVCAGYPCGDEDGGGNPVFTLYPVCTPGKYGLSCSDDCPGRCNNESVCHVVSAHCTDGCEDGYWKEDCTARCGHCTHKTCFQSGGRAGDCLQDGCDTGFSGPKCNTSCPSNCIGKTCDQHSTHCTIGCIQGWYGSTCASPCPVNCDSGMCDSVSGNCLRGCSPGWWYGEKCDNLCHHNCTDPYCNSTHGDCTSCNEGWYGSACTDHCPSKCYTNNCGFETGICEHGCQVGFYGDRCEEKCPKNCFDDICWNDGKCLLGCDTGWKGTYCDEDEDECEWEGDGHLCDILEKECHNIPGSYLCCDENDEVSSETMTCQPKKPITEEGDKMPGYGIAVIVILAVLCAGLACVLIYVLISRKQRHTGSNSHQNLVNVNEEKGFKETKQGVSTIDIQAQIPGVGTENIPNTNYYQKIAIGPEYQNESFQVNTEPPVNDYEEMPEGRDSPGALQNTIHK